MSNLRDTYDDLNDALEEAEDFFHENYPGIRAEIAIEKVGFVPIGPKWGLAHKNEKGEYRNWKECSVVERVAICRQVENLAHNAKTTAATLQDNANGAIKCVKRLLDSKEL
jgi:hypothetical protein